MKTMKKIICVVFVLCCAFFSQAQHVLVMHDQQGSNDVVIRKGKRVKIETTQGRILRGTLAMINDSSLVVQQDKQTEVNLSEIRAIYVRKPSGWKTAGGVLLAYYSVAMTTLVAGLVISETQRTPVGSQRDNPLTGLIIGSAIVLPAMYAGTYYSLFHKRRFDVRDRYKMYILPKQ
jgi:hypothetical protein